MQHLDFDSPKHLQNLIFTYINPFIAMLAAVTQKTTNKVPNLNLSWLSPPSYEHVKRFLSKCTVLKVHFCYTTIKYIVCRHVYVHFSAQTFHRLRQ